MSYFITLLTYCIITIEVKNTLFQLLLLHHQLTWQHLQNLSYSKSPAIIKAFIYTLVRKWDFTFPSFLTRLLNTSNLNFLPIALKFYLPLIKKINWANEYSKVWKREIRKNRYEGVNKIEVNWMMTNWRFQKGNQTDEKWNTRPILQTLKNTCQP